MDIALGGADQVRHRLDRPLIVVEESCRVVLNAREPPRRRLRTMAESSQPGRSGEVGRTGTSARPLWITAPTVSCSSRLFRGTCELPINKKMARPTTGTEKISSSQAIADDGRRPSGTSPRRTRLIRKSNSQIRVAIIETCSIPLGTLGRWVPGPPEGLVGPADTLQRLKPQQAENACLDDGCSSGGSIEATQTHRESIVSCLAGRKDYR